jgi:hypothetical protein
MTLIKEQLAFTNCVFCEGRNRAQRDVRRSDRPTAIVTRALLQRADELIWNDMRIATRQLETKPSGSKGSMRNSWCLRLFKRMCLLGSTKHNFQAVQKILCSELFPVTWLMVKAVLSLCMKKIFIIWTADKIRVSGMASSILSSEEV